jgi:DNA (cytosine-5)-methyltransferase 1
VRRDSAPRREAGKSSPRSPRAGAEGRSLTGYVVTAGDQKLPERRDWIYVNDLGISAPLDQTGSNPDRAQGGTLIGPADAPSFSWPVEVADPLSAHEQHTYTHESTTFRMHNVVPDVVAFQSNLGSQGGDVFTNVSPTVRLGGSGNPPAIAFKASHYTRGKDGAPSEVTPPLSADADKGDQDTLVAAVSTGRGYWNASEVGEKAVIARLLASGRYTEDDVASTVAARDYKSATDLVATSWTPAIAGPLGGAAQTGGFRTTDLDNNGAYIVEPLPFDTNQVTSVANGSNPQHGDPSHPLTRFGSAPTIAFAAPTMAVRRLTPRECERLQGFPDDWTAITYKGKPASDGPRYKALGNSMACNVMRWIGQRIANHESGNV